MVVVKKARKCLKEIMMKTKHVQECIYYIKKKKNQLSLIPSRHMLKKKEKKKDYKNIG